MDVILTEELFEQVNRLWIPLDPAEAPPSYIQEP